MAINETTASWNALTQSLYRISGEVSGPYTATLSNIAKVKWNKITGTVFYDRQLPIKTKSIGNFMHTYEYFNTTGRKENNLNFRYADQTLPTVYSATIEGEPSFLIPERSIIVKNIFACKFSSPGGPETNARGAVDVEAGEYSSYNSINLRNGNVRQYLNDDTATPMNLNDSSSYTRHKTNKNTQYYVNSSGQILSKSDNGFVQHSIPYHMDQAAWLSASIGRTEDYRQHLVNSHRQTGSEYYYTSTDVFDVQRVRSRLQSGSNQTSTYTSDYSAMFGWNTWKQLRAAENSKSRLLRNNSYITLDRKDTTNEGRGTQVQQAWLLGSGSFDTSSEGYYLFKEPQVQFTNEYIEYDVYDGDVKVLSLSEDVFHNIFLNPELNNANGIEDSDINTQLKYLENIPNKRFVKRIKKQLFPDPKYAGLGRTNSRENFMFTAWRDDDVVTTNGTSSFNFRNARGFTTNQNIPLYLSGASDFYTYSTWPLDFYYHSSSGKPFRAGGVNSYYYRIPGELMIGASDIGEFLGGKRHFAKYAGVLYRTGTYSEIYKGIKRNDSGSLPWTAYISASSIPFADTNEIYSKDTRNKFKDYSTIPEFNISEFINSSTFSTLKQTIYDNSFNFQNTGSYNILSSTESERLGNIKELNFDIASVIRMTPYKNFYPCQKVLDITKIYSETLSSVSYFNTLDAYGPYSFIIGMPFFLPGILLNSIKAGMPVSYTMLSHVISFVGPVYSFLTTEFENIFEPSKYAKNKQIWQVHITESIDTKQYTNALTNFLDELRHTFCKNNSLNYFDSSLEENYKIFTAGTTYSADITVEVGKVDKTNRFSSFNWIGGVNYIGRKSFEDYGTYAINYPIWYQDDISASFNHNGLSTTRLSFTPTTTRKYTLDEILSNLTVEHRINKITSSLASILFDSSYLQADLQHTEYLNTVTSSFNILSKKLDSNGNSYWNINSKWEFPFLAMTGALLNIQGDSGRARDSETGSYIGGLWHDFCDVPKADQGLFVSITDVEYYSGSSAIKSASLADQVGFPKGIKKRVGELNDSKEIAELLCIIPVNTKDNSFFKLPIDTSLYTENKKHFKRYIIPPKLDYVHGPVEPVVMFMTEISDVWSKRDLAIIYQNMLPQNGLTFKEKNSVYSVTDPKIINILKNQEVKFMIFKCKMRSHTNRDEVVGYNYMYDQFSLCEMARINISYEEERHS